MEDPPRKAGTKRPTEAEIAGLQSALREVYARLRERARAARISVAGIEILTFLWTRNPLTWNRLKKALGCGSVFLRNCATSNGTFVSVCF